MLDFAVYDLEYDMEVFFDLFLSSGVARRFESGDFSLIAGMSGIELAYKVLECLGRDHERIKPRFTQNRSPEYWTGWALAYYQWETALSFSEITQYIPIKDIADLYSPYHEMDIRQFTDKMNELYGRAKTETNLRILRKKAGLTQKELAELSGVPLRTVQQYEQRRKDINKARAEYVVALSKVLYCDAEDLLEKHT